MRQELAKDVVSTEDVDFVGQQELFWFRVENGFASSDTSVVDLSSTNRVSLDRLRMLSCNIQEQ